MMNFTPPQEIQLRDYQAAAIEGLREGIRAGKRKQILCAGTGAGKTVCAAHLLKEADKKGSYAVFLADRVALVNQSSEVFDQYGINHGIVQGANERWLPRENVQVASAQTLARRSLPRVPDLIVVDECHCFVAGTEIATPEGPKRIEEIREGDAVFNAFGIGRVRQMFHHETAQEIVKVRLEDGTEIECTADHRFFTGNSWVQARFLDGESAIRIEDMPSLWDYLSTENSEDRKGELACGPRAELETPESLLEQLCKEIEEPDAQFKNAPKNFRKFEEDWSPSKTDGRQWAWPHKAAAEAIRISWSRLGAGDGGADWDAESGRASITLQNRPSESEFNDCDRGGRGEPLHTYGPGQRPAEDGVSFLKRVVSVESVKRRGSTPVYNLHVSGHPSYFANGALVHNCQYKSNIDYINMNPQAVVVGLTATPFTKGMGEHWDGVVNVIPTRKLIDQGHLVEPTIYVARSPEDKDLGLNSYGEFSDSGAERAGVQIIGDVVEEWIGKTNEHFGGPVKTIVFSPTVEHGRELCAAFSAKGFNFQQISYLDRSDDERAAKIEEFRRPDSMIHGLVSCGVLTKGFDVPDCLVGISCKPYRKSLSSHMQEIGRIMRKAPGKDKALWLCHSGNVERFALDTFDVWENGAGELSHATKQDSTPRERNEATREAVVCQECSGAMRGPTCMACGWEKPARSGIHAVEGELQAFDLKAAAGMETRPGLRAECLKEPKVVWAAALAFTSERTRKGEAHARKWAYGVWRGIYPKDKLPFGWFDMPIPTTCDQNAYGLIDREIKRFRRGAKK